MAAQAPASSPDTLAELTARLDTLDDDLLALADILGAIARHLGLPDFEDGEASFRPWADRVSTAVAEAARKAAP